MPQILAIETQNRIKEWLDFLGYWNNPSDLENLKKFQSDNGLVADGVFGQKTFNAMRTALLKFYCFEMDCLKVQKIQMPADKVGNGFDFFRLRTDAAYWYRKLWNELKEYGAHLTSSGSDRALSAKVSANRSEKSMHYPAIAFDLFVYSGMVNPELDTFIIEKDGDYWRVWVRADKGELRTIQNPCTYQKRTGTGKPITAKVLDFTAIAQRYHFQRIKCRKSFFTDLRAVNQTASEWWHFQNEFCLMPYFSTFGQELQEIFPLSQLEKSSVWEHSGALFKQSWF